MKYLSLVAMLFASVISYGQTFTTMYPQPNTTVSMPVYIRFQSHGCNGHAPVSTGYSIDYGSTTFNASGDPYDISVYDSKITAGKHILHEKTWTAYEHCTTQSFTFTASSTSPVTNPPPPPPPVTPPPTSLIPSNAIFSGYIDDQTGWAGVHDAATPGTASGSMVYPTYTPSVDGQSREFIVNYTDHGGERYRFNIAYDEKSTHFVYDTYIYIPDTTPIANVEMDMNQAFSDGHVVIYGVQCSVYSHSWEYTTSTGTKFHWNRSNVPCNVQNWSKNTWHHIQLAAHRDANYNVTYDWINFDETITPWPVTAKGYDGKMLNWTPGRVSLNFQLDGSSVYSGTMKAYLDKTAVYRW